LLLAACAPDPRDRLEPIPAPDLSGLGASAADRLGERHAGLEELLARPDVVGRELGEAFGELGMLSHAGKLIDSAAACYRNAERLTPKDPRWPYYLGHLDRQDGRWEDGAQSFERALELEPDDVATLSHLANLYVDMNELAKAETLFSRAFELGDVSARVGLGQVRMAEGDLLTAAEHFEAVLAQVPTADRIHYHLGVIHGRLGDDERSRWHMDRQGPGLPQPADPRMDEIRALKESFRDRGAPRSLDELRAAEAANPEDPVLHLELGTALANEGSLDQAEEHYRRAADLSRDRQVKQNANLNLASLLAARGRHAEAIESYTTLIENDRDGTISDQARFELAQALLALDRPDEAELHYRELLESGPQEPSTYVALARALVERGRFEAARWVFERGRDALPRDGTVAGSFAMFLATCPDDAVRDGTLALQLASSLFAAHRTGPYAAILAAALATNGRFQEAADLQRAAVAEAEGQGRDRLADELRQHLSLYESGVPLRQP